jgi:tripartite-type tricarboxylate transporter receptor subunit TctC
LNRLRYAAVILRCERAASISAFTRVFNALWLHASLEGWRLLIMNSSDVAAPRPSPFEARPAEEAGRAPQGDGESETTAAIAICLLILLSALPSAALAQGAGGFYRGKTVTLLIGVNVGGSYDRDARLIARHLGAHIPGNPTVVPQNMIGGGGIAMANHMQTVAVKDGTVIGMMPNTLPMNEMSGMAGVRYDIGKFRWIGSMMPPAHSAMVSWHTTGVRSIDDARRRTITAGASPKGSFVYTMPALLNEYLGTKFKIVAGYQGIASVYLAMERGEVESQGVTWGEFRIARPQLVKDRKINVLVQSTPKSPDLMDVPTLDELAQSDDDRGIIGFLLSGDRLGRPLAAPPGTPDDRVKVLRAAFDATMKDEGFLKEVEASRAEFGPISGEALEAGVAGILKTPPQWVDRARKILE